MPKITASNMTPAELVELIGRMRVTVCPEYQVAAELLGVSAKQLWAYRNGVAPIPVTVARLAERLAAETPAATP